MPDLKNDNFSMNASHKSKANSRQKLNIGINGFGRIGRQVLRMNKDLNIVVINSPANVQTAAHLFKYDSVHGVYPGKVSVDKRVLILIIKKYIIYLMRSLKIFHGVNGMWMWYWNVRDYLNKKKN